MEIIDYYCIEHFISNNMKTNNHKILILFALFLFLLPSCETTKNYGGDTIYEYRTRVCGAVNVNNAWLRESSYKSDKIDDHGVVIMELLRDEQIDYDHYLLRILVNEKKREYPYFVYPHDYGVDWADPDPEMEQALRAYFENRPKTRADYAYTRADYGDDFRIVEYRTEPLDYIRVTADVPLFGREAGDLLDDKWDVYGEEYPFFFDSSKNLILMQYPWGAMDDYMDFSPMTPAILYLQLNEKPQEVPVTLRFAVEVKVEGKESFRDTTRTITLL